MMRRRHLVVLLATLLLASRASAEDTCVGDCDHSGTVTVEELVTGVGIALGDLPLGQCPAFDCNGSGQVTVDCVIAAVHGALNGCMTTATPTPVEAATSPTPTPSSPVSPSPAPTCFFPSPPPLTTSFEVDPPAPLVGDVVQVTAHINTGAGPPTLRELPNAAPVFDMPHVLGTSGSLGAYTVTLEMDAVQAGMATLTLNFDYEITAEICDPLQPIYQFVNGSAAVDLTVAAPPTLSATVTATATPTPTATLTATATTAPTFGPCDAGLLQVAPVTSPTQQLVQTIHITSLVPGSLVTVSVRTNSVLEYVTYSDADLPQEIDLPFALLAGGTSHLTACFQSTACQGLACTASDINGDPLQIHQVIPTPRPALQTFTPLPSPTATSTPAAPPQTPTATPFDCGAPPPVVGPVVSPTNALTQVITGYAEIAGPSDFVSACSPAGCVTSPLRGSFMYYHAFALEVPLTAGMQNPVQVCTFDNCGGRACVDSAVNGEALLIDQVGTAP